MKAPLPPHCWSKTHSPLPPSSPSFIWPLPPPPEHSRIVRFFYCALLSWQPVKLERERTLDSLTLESPGSSSLPSSYPASVPKVPHAHDHAASMTIPKAQASPENPRALLPRRKRRKPSIRPAVRALPPERLRRNDRSRLPFEYPISPSLWQCPDGGLPGPTKCWRFSGPYARGHRRTRWTWQPKEPRNAFYGLSFRSTPSNSAMTVSNLSSDHSLSLHIIEDLVNIRPCCRKVKDVGNGAVEC